VGRSGNIYTKKWVKGLSPPPDTMTFSSFLTILTYKINPWHSVRPIFINKVMHNYLSNIPTIVECTGEEYQVLYVIEEQPTNIVGGCTYKEWKNKSKFQVEPIYILTQVYMMDILSYINEKSPLNEGDLINLQREIREHSLSILKHHLSSGSLSQI